MGQSSHYPPSKMSLPRDINKDPKSGKVCVSDSVLTNFRDKLKTMKRTDKRETTLVLDQNSSGVFTTIHVVLIY